MSDSAYIVKCEPVCGCDLVCVGVYRMGIGLGESDGIGRAYVVNSDLVFF
jgi:hypothetical protein